MEFLCEFGFHIKHVKGKKNKVANALISKFHVTTLNICKTDLIMNIFEASTNDEFFLEVKREL